MIRFAARRLAGMALVLFAISVLVLLVFNVIPNGDPAVRMAGRSSTDVEVRAIREAWGFDEPLPEQYVAMLRQVVSGELVSYVDRRNVLDEIAARLPRTLALALGAAVLWLVLGVALGVVGAMRAGRLSDRLLGALAVLGSRCRCSGWARC